jgi:hypothetical protein
VVLEVENEPASGTRKTRTIVYKRPTKKSRDDDFDFDDEGTWSEPLSNIIIYDEFFVNKYVSAGLTVGMSCDLRMFELAMGALAKEEPRKIGKIGIKARQKLEKTACDGYQRTTNKFLKALNAPFQLKLKPAFNSDPRRSTSCHYSVVMHGQEIQILFREITDDRHLVDVPDFSSTLSGGDRNTLALALFFAYLDRGENLDQKVVVIDDPITSLDDHRARVTVEQIASFVPRAMQMIILSHDKRFLLRILEKIDHWRDLDVKALEVVRDGQGSVVRDWNTNEDRITEHDRYHKLLLTYYSQGKCNKIEVAAAIRPMLEGFIRVAYPEDMPAGTLLGKFLMRCRERLKNKSLGRPILNRRDITELQNLVDFGNLFHHETNPKFETKDVDDGELRGFVGRTIAFTRRPIRP